jgi:competence protein ComEC
MRSIRLVPVHLALGGYCLGLCLSLWLSASPWLLLALGAALAAPAVLQHAVRDGVGLSGTAVVACLAASGILVLAAAGMLVGGARLSTLAQSDLAVRVGEKVELRAAVTDLPKLNGLRATVPLHVTAVDGRAVDEPARITLDLPDEAAAERLTDPVSGLTEGLLVVLAEASVRPLPEPPREGFDYGRYLRRRGEHVLLAAPLESLRVVGRRGGLAGLTDQLRRAARANLGRGVPPPVREVLQGMVLGDDEGIDEGLAEAFRRSGLMHIMAVSGENVVLVCALLGAVLGALGLGRRWRLLILLPSVAIYVVVAGASPSIVRAGIAGGITLVAGLAARPTDAPILLLLPASVMLTLNPNTLYDVSFQLSFAAVAGLVLLGSRLVRSFRWLPRSLAEQAGITTSASLATAPVSLAAFGSVSFVAVPANLVGGFVLGPVMLLGMLSVAVGFAWPAASAALNIVAGTLIAFLVQVARLFASLPGAAYTWHGLTLSVMLCLLALAAFVVLPALAGRRGLSVVRYLASGGRAGIALLVLCVPVALTLLLAPSAPAGPASPTVTFLDVGEGSATLIQAPGAGTVLVDAGPEPLAGALWRHGVRTIDLLVLSHGHADHVGGLRDLIGGLPITTALLPRPPTPDAKLDELASDLQAAGTKVLRCAAPTTARCGGFSLCVLPTRAAGTTGNQGENDNALVVVVECAAGSVLLPGDAEASALDPLDVGPCEVVAAPHHGSDDGFSRTLLAELQPELAVISVGAGNRYGHPAPDTLALLAEAGVPVLRTDRAGEVDLVLSEGQFRMVAHARQ